MKGKPVYGSDLIVDLLKNLDIAYTAFNPGATFRGIHDSLVNHGGNAHPEVIECCHEEISVAIAHGYAKATGKPMAALVHNVVGLMHASMAIFNAWCDRVPMLVLGGTGPMDLTTRRPWIDWIHTALVQGNMVREFVKWDDQPHNLASVPESLLRAYRIAMTGPQGPVYLCYDVDIQEQKMERELPPVPPQAYLLPTPIQAEPAALQKVAEMLAAARRPVAMADFVGRSPAAFRALKELAELLAMPVLDGGDRAHSLTFPSTHPLALMGAEEELLAEADLVLALEVEDLYGALNRVAGRTGRAEPLVGGGARVVHIGLKDLQRNSWVEAYQRYQPVDFPITADLAVALPALLEACRELLPDGEEGWRQERRAQLAEKHMALRAGWLEKARTAATQKPISLKYLALQVGEAIKGENWVLANGSLKEWAKRLWDFREPEQWLGPSGGAGLGYGMGASLGAALAHRNSGKVIVNLQADGDFLFTPEALWTAAHHRLPMLVVMHNNRSYFNSENHQTIMARMRQHPLENAGIGTRLDDPPVDFAALARSFGLYGEGPVTESAQLKPALERALRVVKEEGRLALVDVVTDSH